MHLSDLISWKLNDPNAHVWVITEGPDAGKPVKVYHQAHLGITVTKLDQLDVGYLYYLLEYLATQGLWRNGVGKGYALAQLTVAPRPAPKPLDAEREIPLSDIFSWKLNDPNAHVWIITEGPDAGKPVKVYHQAHLGITVTKPDQLDVVSLCDLIEHLVTQGLWRHGVGNGQALAQMTVTERVASNKPKTRRQSKSGNTRPHNSI